MASSGMSQQEGAGQWSWNGVIQRSMGGGPGHLGAGGKPELGESEQ